VACVNQKLFRINPFGDTPSHGASERSNYPVSESECDSVTVQGVSQEGRGPNTHHGAWTNRFNIDSFFLVMTSFFSTTAYAVRVSASEPRTCSTALSFCLEGLEQKGDNGRNQNPGTKKYVVSPCTFTLAWLNKFGKMLCHRERNLLQSFNLLL